jgi:hypothetical protein
MCTSPRMIQSTDAVLMTRAWGRVMVDVSRHASDPPALPVREQPVRAFR